MILGDTCTRSCGFCAVKTGFGGSIDHLEPKRLAKGIENLKLNNIGNFYDQYFTINEASKRNAR